MKYVVKVKRFMDNKVRMYAVPACAVASVAAGVVVKVPFAHGSSYGVCKSDVMQLDDAQYQATRFALGLDADGDFMTILSVLIETPIFPCFDDEEPLETGDPITFPDDAEEGAEQDE